MLIYVILLAVSVIGLVSSFINKNVRAGVVGCAILIVGLAALQLMDYPVFYDLQVLFGLIE